MSDSITTTNAGPDTSVSIDTITYYTCNKIGCEKCDGTGYQQRNDGVYVVCPICDGSGMMERKEKCVPCCPPWYPISWGPRREYIITC